MYSNLNMNQCTYYIVTGSGFRLLYVQIMDKAIPRNTLKDTAV